MYWLGSADMTKSEAQIEVQNETPIEDALKDHLTNDRSILPLLIVWLVPIASQIGDSNEDYKGPLPNVERNG